MDGDNFGDGRHQERRRHSPAGQSPMDILRQLPALVVLRGCRCRCWPSVMTEPSCSPMQRLARCWATLPKRSSR